MGMQKGARTRVVTALILLLVLGTGLVLGMALDRTLAAGTSEAAAEGERGRGGDEGEEREGEGDRNSRRRSLIVEQVGLSDTQLNRVDSIVDHYRDRIRALEDSVEGEIRMAYWPRYQELLEVTRGEIKGVLDERQRAMYDSLLIEHDRRMEERRGRNSETDSTGSGR